MTFQDYNSSIPAANNDPSQDQPLMLQNYLSISNLITQDHVGFGNNQGGFHKKTTYIRSLAPPVLPDNTVGAIYQMTAGSEATLFYTPGTTGNQYQLTRTISSKFAFFGQAEGWTFLPGGLVMQWGVVSKGARVTIVFNVPYTTAVYSVVVTPIISSSVVPPPPTFTVIAVGINSFDLVTQFGSNYVGSYWMAIGL